MDEGMYRGRCTVVLYRENGLNVPSILIAYYKRIACSIIWPVAACKIFVIVRLAVHGHHRYVKLSASHGFFYLNMVH